MGESEPLPSNSVKGGSFHHRIPIYPRVFITLIIGDTKENVRALLNSARGMNGPYQRKKPQLFHRLSNPGSFNHEIGKPTQPASDFNQ